MKGQSWSYDLLVAIAIFTLTVILATYLSWSVTVNSASNSLDRLSEGTWALSGTLLSPGNPSDWNSSISTADPSTWSSVTVFGMTEAFGSPNISDGKARALLAMSTADYARFKEALHTPFDVYVEMKEFYDCNNAFVNGTASMNNSAFNCSSRGILPGSNEWFQRDHYVSVGGSNYTLGLRPSSNARQVSVMNSYGVYNNSIVRVRVILWTNRTWQ